MDRREFLKCAAVSGIGAVFAVGMTACSSGGKSASVSSSVSASSVTSSSGASAQQSGASLSTSTPIAVPVVRLNSGYDMPMLGIGTWTLSEDVAEQSVYSALSCGYRLVDTAQYYGNEAGVGRAVKRAEEDGIVARKDLFVTTKISPGSYSDPAPSIDASLDRLGLDYIDLMLIHQPGSNDAGVYRAMEDALVAGKLRSIGISNYYTPAEFDQVMSYAEVTPMVIQNENHLFYQNAELRDYVSQFGTVVESWYPFCGRGHTQDAFGNGEVEDIASARGMTPPQVVARWHVQEGYVAIPGSSNPDHIAENIASLAFELDMDDMRRLRALDSRHRYEHW